MVNKIKKTDKTPPIDSCFVINLLPLPPEISINIVSHVRMILIFRKLLLAALQSLVICSVAAQALLPEQEIKMAPQLSASNNLAYPVPSDKLTPAPKGMKPFYLSHYGRHGSRYLTKTKDYSYVCEVLQKAAEEGKLSLLGESVLQRANRLHKDAENRWGDLTPLGGQQLEDITRRMVENYPEIFADGTHVDARSTLIPRCVLSMTYAIRQMVLMKPQLNITFDATHYDMSYMNFQDKVLMGKNIVAKAQDAYENYRQTHQCWQRVVGSLFNDTAYVRKNVDGEELNYYLFRLAGSVQNTNLASELTFYDLFTTEELVSNWRVENIFWFLGYSFSPLSSGCQPYTQRNLLRKIIEQADSCIRLPEPNVHLRYGHETMVLPLTCLMGLNGYDQVIEDLDQIDHQGWVNYRVFPMGCNVQMVFYRRHPSDQDVMVKVLLNETEARLPIPSKTAPYYRWNEVRDFYLNRLNSYQEIKENSTSAASNKKNNQY